DRLDAVVGGGALNAPEQLLANPAPAIALLDGKGRLGVDVPSERRLLAPDRMVGAQFGRAAHVAVDERPVDEIALPEALLGVMHQEVVRHAAPETLMPAERIEPQQVIAESFHVRRPEPADFDVG